MGVHHEAIHRNSLWYYITAPLTCSWYLKDFHKVHHKEFLEGVDDFSWARKNENFYKFFMRTHFKRRTFGRDSLFILDVVSFALLSYFLGIYYIMIVVGFTFHWEIFEYWSHYGLKDMTDNKYYWSWNVRDPIFNKITFDVGLHSKHHVAGEGHFPLIYSKNLFNSYLPLIPSMFFKFMDKQVILNREKGVLI